MKARDADIMSHGVDASPEMRPFQFGLRTLFWWTAAVALSLVSGPFWLLLLVPYWLGRYLDERQDEWWLAAERAAIQRRTQAEEGRQCPVR